MTDTEWRERAERLAALLAERGDLTDEAWRLAVSSVPRHLIVPIAYRQEPATGAWQRIDTSTGDGLDLAYSPETLVTALDGSQGYPVAVSSSTKPDLMLRMLSALDIRDGHRVLEIGTGTGYNAALLVHRLGQENVFSVDIDADLVDSARQRLADIGAHPTLVAVDGTDGLPEYAPYDRIIATCSVPRVPWAWVDQLTADGQLLVDIEVGSSAGNLVHLRRLPDRLEGRFTARWATFMAMRHRAGEAHPHRAAASDDPAKRATSAPPNPWRNQRVAWFLAQFALPDEVRIGMRLDPETRMPTATTLSAPDGSWAEVEIAERDGARHVREAGPTPLWGAVEEAYKRWRGFDQPDWPRLGLTVDPATRAQTIWLDGPGQPIAVL